MTPLPFLRASLLLTLAAAPLAAQQAADPRVGLKAGWKDAGEAIRHLRLLAHRDRPAGFENPQDLNDFGIVNTDLAFQGDYAFVGSYNGFQVWNIADPSAPTLRTAFVCPGGQGDVSVHGPLLFMSVEETRGRVDCGTQGVEPPSSPERFMGVRIFDISNLDAPRQVATVQSCRGSHTHTLVTDPRDADHVYVYISGTGEVRPGTELAGCSDSDPSDPANSRFRIEVIRVPLARPQDAKIVSQPRIFADVTTGRIGGLYKGGKYGAGTQEGAETDQCHDITVYPALGLAAGACSGNGILLDITSPANPRRLDEVIDTAFAYWHSATFSNDGTTLLFSDEWGGGVGPRCRATDKPIWGANAIFAVADGKMSHRGYYKIPAAQAATENCVAHNGSLIPVPGRNIMVQAWYQGGLSVFDFTDPAKPFEIAFFDRGPVSAQQLVIAGYWSAYWYNGAIVGSEIGRGLDLFDLEPSEFLSANEIAAAKLVRMERFNPQLQEPLTWPPHVAVARSYLDQLARSNGLPAATRAALARGITAAEGQSGPARAAAFTRLAAQASLAAPRSTDRARVQALAAALRALASAS